MPVDSTKAMPSSTFCLVVWGRLVWPCTAGFRGGISGSTSAQSSSLINRGGGEDADDDMAGSLRRSVNRGQSPTTYLRNVFLRATEGNRPLRGRRRCSDTGPACCGGIQH